MNFASSIAGLYHSFDPSKMNGSVPEIVYKVAPHHLIM